MTPILEAELAVPAQCELAEGPVWDVRRGLLWRVDILAGTMAWDETGNPPGSLYRLSPDGIVTELFGDVGLSNGLDWTDDRRRF